MNIGDVFREFGKDYRTDHRLAPHIRKSMVMIEKCGTGELGCHQLECDTCGTKFLQENSCRNRHCPVCQKESAKNWAVERTKELLPIPYYHVIFTIPDSLNWIVQTNQKIMYDILFKASAETLLTLIEDPKYVGGKGGVISVLHTWGQNLMEHPHIHSLVPAGALSVDESYFIEPKNSKYLIPVHVISNLFKKKFMAYWVKAVHDHKVKFIGNCSNLNDPKKFKKLKNDLYRKGWITHIRPPFSTGEIVIEYLSRYLKRVAISNERILSVHGNNISVKWTDNRDGKTKIMVLDVNEFIRRFLLHILPNRYVKIRYYGFMSNSQRKKQLKKCRSLLRFRVKSKEIIEKDDESKKEPRCLCAVCRHLKSPLITKKIPVRARDRPIV